MNADKMKTSVDWQVMAEGLKDMLKKELSTVLVGAKEDLVKFAEAMTADLVQAMSTGREDLVNEIGAQARTVAEANRLRIVDSTWDVVGGLMTVAVKSALVALSSVK